MAETDNVRPRLDGELEPNAFLESLVNAMPDVVVATNLDGRILVASRRSAAMHGCASEKELIGKSAFTLIAPEDHERAAENLRRTLSSGMSGPLEYDMLRVDGTRFRGELNAAVVPGPDGAPRAFVAAVRDITERRRAERALRESDERCRNLVALMPDPVVVLQDEGYCFVSSAFSEVFGYTQEDVAAGLNVYDHIPERQREAARRRIARRLAGEELSRTYRVELIAKDGQIIPCESSASLIQHDGRPAILAVLRDLREREEVEERERRLAEQMQRAQKMESLGLLAGGVAHDFNNLLVGVLAHAGLARRALPRDSVVRANVDMIETAAHRAAELCDQLLAYSGREQPVLTEVNLSELASEMSELLHIPLAKKAHMRLELAEVPHIAADPTQLRQLFMNLVQNAADATSAPEGEVVVRTGVLECDAAFVDNNALEGEMAPGLHVFVEVRDNGCGMDPQTVARAFEPFFTTKRRGRGLGLAVVRGFAAAHRGAIQVESSPGEGTVFRIFFPVLGRSRTALAAAEGRNTLSGTVLLVDDEQMVREVLEEILAESGLDVVSAGSGEEALETLSGRSRAISAAIVDVHLPGMSGEALIGKLREVDPELPVLLATGFRTDTVSRFLASHHRVELIDKPFDLDELVGVLRKALS